MSAVPTVSFEAIREHESSQQRAFEELCYLIVPTVHQLPPGTRRPHQAEAPRWGDRVLVHRSIGDGQVGVAGKVSRKWTSSAFGQMKRSFVKALSQQSDLTRYILLLPTELTGPAERAWRRHVGGWTKLAAEKGMSVQLADFVGHSDLLGALLDPKHAGVVRYFFDRTFLTPSYFAQQVDREVRNLGRRYRAEVHVDLEISADLEGIARSDQWRWRLDEETRDRVRLYDLKDPTVGDDVSVAVNGGLGSKGAA